MNVFKRLVVSPSLENWRSNPLIGEQPAIFPIKRSDSTPTTLLSRTHSCLLSPILPPYQLGEHPHGWRAKSLVLMLRRLTHTHHQRPRCRCSLGAPAQAGHSGHSSSLCAYYCNPRILVNIRRHIHRPAHLSLARCHPPSVSWCTPLIAMSIVLHH
jgi:hypothetical protein